MSSSGLLSTHAGSSIGAVEDKPPMCLSPQDKLKGSVKASMTQRKKQPMASAVVAAFAAAATSSSSAALTVKTAAAFAMDFDMSDAVMDLDVDLDLDFMDDGEDDQDMDEAGWISDDNLRALEFDERLNQDIDWVTHDDVDTSLKLDFVPSGDDNMQDFAFDPSSFLSPLRGGLSFDDSDVSSSFAESLSVETPPPSFGSGHDAEKLLMSFDTMNFTIPSPTSSSSKKRASLFGKKDADAKGAASTAKNGSAALAAAAARQSLATKGTMSPSLKMKAGGSSSADETRKDDVRGCLSKLSIPSPEPFLGVLSITTPTAVPQSNLPPKKIGSYSPEARKLRIAKFHEKRKNRTWKKSIKYDCRKKLADDRPRIKGRFVRVLENTPEVKEEPTATAAVGPTVDTTNVKSAANAAPLVSAAVPTAFAAAVAQAAAAVAAAAPVKAPIMVVPPSAPITAMPASATPTATPVQPAAVPASTPVPPETAESAASVVGQALTISVQPVPSAPTVMLAPTPLGATSPAPVQPTVAATTAVSAPSVSA